MALWDPCWFPGPLFAPWLLGSLGSSWLPDSMLAHGVLGSMPVHRVPGSLWALTHCCLPVTLLTPWLIAGSLGSLLVPWLLVCSLAPCWFLVGSLATSWPLAQCRLIGCLAHCWFSDSLLPPWLCWFTGAWFIASSDPLLTSWLIAVLPFPGSLPVHGLPGSLQAL